MCKSIKNIGSDTLVNFWQVVDIVCYVTDNVQSLVELGTTENPRAWDRISRRTWVTKTDNFVVKLIVLLLFPSFRLPRNSMSHSYNNMLRLGSCRFQKNTRFARLYCIETANIKCIIAVCVIVLSSLWDYFSCRLWARAVGAL